MKAQRGQALVEGAIALVLLAGILSTIPCLVTYQDVQRTALQAARDASFMAGWAGLGAPEAAVSRARSALSPLPWRHPADGTRVLDASREPEVVALDGPPPGRAAALMDFIASPLQASSDGVGGSLALDCAGFHQVRLAVQVPALRGAPEPFSALPLRLEERAAVLTEVWNAGTPAQIIARVRGVVPSSHLSRLTASLSPLAAPLRLIEPALAQLCIGLIEPDRLPLTRLSETGLRAVGAAAGDDRCR